MLGGISGTGVRCPYSMISRTFSVPTAKSASPRVKVRYCWRGSVAVAGLKLDMRRSCGTLGCPLPMGCQGWKRMKPPGADSRANEVLLTSLSSRVRLTASLRSARLLPPLLWIFRCRHGESVAVLAGTGRFDGRTECQQVGLVGDVVDDADLVGDGLHR